MRWDNVLFLPTLSIKVISKRIKLLQNNNIRTTYWYEHIIALTWIIQSYTPFLWNKSEKCVKIQRLTDIDFKLIGLTEILKLTAFLISEQGIPVQKQEIKEVHCVLLFSSRFVKLEYKTSLGPRNFIIWDRVMVFNASFNNCNISFISWWFFSLYAWLIHYVQSCYPISKGKGSLWHIHPTLTLTIFIIKIIKLICLLLNIQIS